MWCLPLLAHPLGHEPVQDAHVEISWSEVNTGPPKIPEVIPVSKSVQLDEGAVNGPDLELLGPEAGPRPVDNVLLKPVVVEASDLLRVHCSPIDD